MVDNLEEVVLGSFSCIACTPGNHKGNLKSLFPGISDPKVLQVDHASLIPVRMVFVFIDWMVGLEIA